jgi:hypothetical protein
MHRVIHPPSSPCRPVQDEYARATRLSRANGGSSEGEGRQGHSKAPSMSGLSLGLALASGPLSPLAASKASMLLGRGPHRWAARLLVPCLGGLSALVRVQLSRCMIDARTHSLVRGCNRSRCTCRHAQHRDDDCIILCAAPAQQ